MSLQPDSRTLVAIESPLSGDSGSPEEIQRNTELARRICRFAVRAGYSPYAMHLFFPQFLDEGTEQERNAGIESGLAWTDQAQEIWQCTRPGGTLTRGMLVAQRRNRRRKESGQVPNLKQRRLYFTQQGHLVGGWDGPPLPEAAQNLRCSKEELQALANGDDPGAREVARQELKRRRLQRTTTR